MTLNPRRTLPALAAVLLAAAPPAAGQDPPEPSIRVLVLEDAWRVGDEKTYTLEFDRAPFGRQAMKLVQIRVLPRGGAEAVFRQRITLDLRALGQEGTLEQSGTLVYLREKSGPYRYQEAVLRGNGYDTYRNRRDYAATGEVDLDPEQGSYRVARSGEEERRAPLPEAAEAILIDLLAVGQWERVFSKQRKWLVGETVEVPLLVPSELPRLDFHIDIAWPRPVEPELVQARIKVEAREEVEIFGARIPAFRCRVSPGGWTIWVSPLGGVLRFDDGRGLTGSLEP